MQDILILVHRIPYPPDKGDKIRSFNIVRYLSERHKVRLGCFIDNPDDFKHVSTLSRMCEDVYVSRLQPWFGRVRSLAGFWKKEALALPYYRDQGMTEWVGKTLSSNPVSAVLAYSSPMAQYVLSSDRPDLRVIFDFVDVDSDKWRQYAESRSPVERWLYRREASHLSAFERAAAARANAVTFVSLNERKLFDSLSPDTSEVHHVVPNGVDLNYFDRRLNFVSPYAPGSVPIVFTGMMDYWPNSDAVIWFANEIFPIIRRQEPRAEFWIVGAAPGPSVRQLENRDNVRVTGRVVDVRPYLAHAAVSVAPLRISRGVQNKALEALAMGTPVVCTTRAIAGLVSGEKAPLDAADDSTIFAERVIARIRGTAHQPSEGPEYVSRCYNWDVHLRKLEDLIVSRDSRLSRPVLVAGNPDHAS